MARLCHQPHRIFVVIQDLDNRTVWGRWAQDITKYQNLRGAAFQSTGKTPQHWDVHFHWWKACARRIGEEEWERGTWAVRAHDVRHGLHDTVWVWAHFTPKEEEGRRRKRRSSAS